MDEKYIFLDLETTGIDPNTDGIVEIGAVKTESGIVTGEFHTLVNPADLGPTGPKLLGFIGSIPIVGHNISFNIAFLEKGLKCNISNPVLDMLDFLHFLLPTAGSYRLDGLKADLGTDGEVYHRALDDARTACRVFFNCLERLRRLDTAVLLRVLELLGNRDGYFAITITKIITRTLKSFPESKALAPFAYMLDRLEEPGLFIEKRRDFSASAPQMSSLHKHLEPDGSMASSNPHYKYRSGQAEMLEAVSRGFQESNHMVIEAGTGTGKSMAYLLPAVVWALTNKTRVVVATHTINLQEQLISKDLPEIRDSLNLEISSVLVKGRNNYLCLRRWEEKMQNAEAMNNHEVMFCLKLLTWLTETYQGDRSELNISGLQAQYWNELGSDQETCIGPACRHHHRHCFVSKARRQAEAADILIVNHSLLLADLKMQHRFLPSFDYLIIDEAHHLEECATEQLGRVINTNQIRSSLMSMTRGFSGGLGPGLLNQVRQAVKNNPDLFGSYGDKPGILIDEAFERVKNINDSIDEIEMFFSAWTPYGAVETEDEAIRVSRITEHHRAEKAWEGFEALTDNFCFRTSLLIQTLDRIARLFNFQENSGPTGFEPLVKDIGYQSGYLADVNDGLKTFCFGLNDSVFWIELTRAPKQELKFRCAPVSVSDQLSSGLFQSKKSILLTSATISVDGSFEHFMKRVGLDGFDDDRVIRKIIVSPFNYEKQAALYVIKDLSDPAAGGDNGDFAEDITPVIGDVARIFGGKMLVLFTSHKMLRSVYYKLQPLLGQEGITLLGHGIDGGRTRLAEIFRGNDKTVLFGTSSFWEGIDLPGEILKCVVIVRLPFAPPTSPVIEARVEEIAAKNKDPFYTYMVPEAIIKLKQGFGRLIRTEEDEGVVLVLDRRLVDRKYGRKFLHSLPVKTHFKGDTCTVLQKIHDWVRGDCLPVETLNILEGPGDIEKYFKSRNIKGAGHRSDINPF